MDSSLVGSEDVYKRQQQIFLKRKQHYNKNELNVPKNANLIISVLIIYFCIQDLLPWRHWAIKDDVLWTEEGHRLSWRMMLRSKSGRATFSVVDKETKEKRIVKLIDYLTTKQRSHVSTKPDFIWQFAQYLKKEYAKKGKDISVFVNCSVSVNGKPFSQLIDPNIDLAAVKWNAFKHSDWILASKP